MMSHNDLNASKSLYHILCIKSCNDPCSSKMFLKLISIHDVLQ